MSRLLLIAAVGALLISFSLAHICMWQPRQRGKLSLSNPGDGSCYRPYPVDQCGNSPVEKPQVTYTAGQPVSIEFQQNLNHYYVPKPGYFDVSVSTASHQNLSDSDFTHFVAKMPDFPGMDMVTMTNFTIKGNIPSIACDHCVLRLRYISYNPHEINNRFGDNPDAIFYQCADIRIVKQ